MSDERILNAKLRFSEEGSNGAEQGAKKLEGSLKSVEQQAAKTKEKLDKLSQVGTTLATIGAAILAPFAATMSRYVDVSKQADDQRKASAEKTAQELIDLEQERVDGAAKYAQEIISIDNQIAENRLQKEEIVRNAARETANNVMDYQRTLRGIESDARGAALDYAQERRKILESSSSRAEQKRQLRDLDEDYAESLRKQAEAKKQALADYARKQEEIYAKQREEQKKAEQEEKKLQQQKADAQEAEKLRLADLDKREARANAERTKSMQNVDTLAAKILDIMKQWESAQERLGKVTAGIVLPALEKGVSILDKIVAFSEQNPGVVKAALTIGTTLVVLGGLLTTAAKIALMILNIQQLAGSIGLLLGSGGAAGAAGATGAAGAAGAAAGGLSAAGIATSVGSALTAILPVAVAALGAVIGLGLANALNNTNYGIGDLVNIGKLLLVTFGELIDEVTSLFGATTSFADTTARALGMTEEEISRFHSAVSQEQQANRAQSVANTQAQVNATTSAGQGVSGSVTSAAQSEGNWFTSLINAITGLFSGGLATGGYADSGLYRMGEQGREFVLNAQSTRAAESLIGAQLSQERVMSMMTTNVKLSSGMTIRQARRMIAQNNSAMLTALAGDL